MSSLKQSPLPTLQALSSSFSDLNTVLQPLLAYDYEGLNSALQSGSSSSKSAEDELHGRLDAARMQVSTAYVLMDLVWILLKTKGVDTTNHPVMQELERVKSYFSKIKKVQEGEKEEKAGAKVDKSAAGRFIRAALQGEASPAGRHTKFDEEETAKAAETPMKEKKDEAEQKEVSTPASGNTKKRQAMDPFEGYDKPKTPKTAPGAGKTDAGSASSSPAKKKKKKDKSSK